MILTLSLADKMVAEPRKSTAALGRIQSISVEAVQVNF